MKRVLIIAVVVTVLAALCGTLALAQDVSAPEQGVRGTGAIYTSTKGIGTFDINVARSAGNLMGGFKYLEAAATNTRGNTIYSQRITNLSIIGNHAKITAVGYWNGMLSDLTVEALDDLNMDWFRIIAKPRNMLQIIYDQSGGLIKGDIVVYSKPVPSGYTKGAGMIAVKSNAGRFQVYAEKAGSQVKGYVHYYEYNPMTLSINERPIVKIYMPAVKSMEFTDVATAVLRGRGYLNGLPAMIEVKMFDASNLNTLVYMPDQFHIKATSLLTSSVYNASYIAGGDLITGDVVVKTSYEVQ